VALIDLRKEYRHVNFTAWEDKSIPILLFDSIAGDFGIHDTVSTSLNLGFAGSAFEFAY
jgi:hypothetical protein